MNFVKCVLDWINKKNKYAKINVKFCFPIYANVESFLQKKRNGIFIRILLKGTKSFYLGLFINYVVKKKGRGLDKCQLYHLYN